MVICFSSDSSEFLPESIFPFERNDNIEIGL